MNYYIKDIKKMTDTEIESHINTLKTKIAEMGAYNPSGTSRAVSNLARFDKVQTERAVCN